MNDRTPHPGDSRFRALHTSLSGPADALNRLAGELRAGVAAAGLAELAEELDGLVEAAGVLQSMVGGLTDPACPYRQMTSLEEAGRALRHDLRNPIAGMGELASLLVEDVDGHPALKGKFLELMEVTGGVLAGLEALTDLNAESPAQPPPEDSKDDGAPEKAAVAETAAQGAGARVSSARAGHNQVSGHILVVDDLQTNRDALARLLTRDGHTVETADGGRQGLAMADGGGFDSILLDINMPDLDGMGVLARLKADDRIRHIPVIMISAHDEEEAIIRCLEAGAEDYLRKPVNPVLLRARLNAGLERKFARDREKGYMEQVEAEKRKSTELLLNILPEQIVERLNSGEELIADKFDDVAVLFSDLVGFTSISAKMGPTALVKDLNAVFTRFDAAAKRLGVEKVKTIGDAYMVVSGLPVLQHGNVAACAAMALDMVSLLDEVNPELTHPFRIRIGLHVGPVVAGIIGSHKFVYDVWGSTVNAASRYESYSEPGKIHVSSDIRDALKGDFEFESRGTLQMRGLGEVETFFLTGRRPAD